jgi:two-component system NtrC family sensor kinase
MGLSPFVLVILLSKMRQTLVRSNGSQEWIRNINKAFVVWGVLIALNSIFHHWDLLNWIWYISVLAVFYLIYRVEDFRRLRNLMYAVLPLILLDVLQELTHLADWEWLRVAEDTLGGLKVIAVFWMITMLVIISRQNKALKEAELKSKHEEELKQIAESQRSELEIMVAQRTAEITRQKEELEQTVEELKATQAQLVHSEKMASLGELTAGIAHEIQNPLNFVNNFSELNTELLAELEEEIRKGNFDEVKLLAHDIRENEAKINHHGKRADAIVKGMLQHSRAGSGQKEPTDLNALADEYLRLAYHGLRAKDKSFNSAMDTDFDPNLGPVNVVPQDLGRVILNLITNAFYAVNEKKHLRPEQYEPRVKVSTKKYPDRVEVRVADNGMGVPQKVLDKIFQPFFTTKPTGQGTGLGLSMSYDIITKGHGGTLKVNTLEGEYAEFVISLPV